MSRTFEALPPTSNDTCISDIAAYMADVKLSISAEKVSRSKHTRAPQGSCAEANINLAW